MRKSSYWIKLYHEILTDPKMGALDDHAWRRAIKLFLLAGETGRGGDLPPIRETAWMLHTSEEELGPVLQALAGLRIVEERAPGEWRVTNFAARQVAASGAERSRSFRQRNESRDETETNCPGNVENLRDENGTNRHRIISQKDEKSAPDTESDQDLYSESDQACEEGSLSPAQVHFARAFRVQPSPGQLSSLAQLEKTHGNRKLSQVIEWAVRSGIPPGRALKSIRTAITTWTEPKPAALGGRARRTGAIEKIRKELSSGNPP